MHYEFFSPEKGNRFGIQKDVLKGPERGWQSTHKTGQETVSAWKFLCAQKSVIGNEDRSLAGFTEQQVCNFASAKEKQDVVFSVWT